MTHDVTDITIIGGGPTGLFASFYAGMRGATAQIVDALPQLGGQLTALYPEKYIFDVAGFPQVLAKDLVSALAEQASRWNFPVHLGHRVTGLEEEDGADGRRHFVLVTEKQGIDKHDAVDGDAGAAPHETHRFPTRSIVLAAGIGAFSARRLPQPCAEEWYGRGIYDVVTNPDDYIGQKVMIIGGGDSAFDWAAQLAHKAESVTLVHRSDRFRAHGATVAEVQANASNGGRTQILTFHELHDIVAEDGRISRIVLRDIKAKATREVEADVVLPMLGFVSDMGAIVEWGLTLEKDEIVVNSQMETGRPGVYAAGDVTTYPGKLKLIATGFGEAATAVNQAVHWVYPEKKVNPGHSSNLAIFGQKDD
jgi:ferredoxin/flavodoxin---NADP+ reductase